MAKTAKVARRKAATAKKVSRRAAPTSAAKVRQAKKKPIKSVVAKTQPATVLDHIRTAASRLRKARVVFAHGTTDPVAEAAFIVGETLGLRPDAIEDACDRRVTKADSAKIRELVEQRVRTRKPAAYLLNRMYMRGLPFYVDERTIVPRSFIGEILDDHFGDEASLQLRDPATVTRVLDLCTGSGCLAILAARAFPNAVIDAADLSADALAVARRNVMDHGLERRIRLVQGDLFTALGGERYDLIISNPPYVDAEGMAGLPRECAYEPKMAFDGGADGIALVRRILSDAGAHLDDDGGLLCEVGRCRPALEAAYPRMPFLWLDTEESEGEVFWLEASQL
ncbi:50S ribosomal protein L3 N(5)-glutamine methyltransferase [Bradyrhizobium sp. LHD-71]|uniref:50S ribosomal protein L3 N(5)-glutamine methyltransferase n=1 Tax=Bradyrhizobium sp. LHD-71 TaxID=3072141 RepID=UPI00280CCEF4|nr:50S ribosomal protein L3 N(5)-glutamine methyltransferase [Bradyrhizobium sp. LHD-71]MDQ8729016.1 50S ribosomal protein L3 N(5)-glutamine methyltransferase [Bradyrhizobium sp. LHD-71]